MVTCRVQDDKFLSGAKKPPRLTRGSQCWKSCPFVPSQAEPHLSPTKTRRWSGFGPEALADVGYGLGIVRDEIHLVENDVSFQPLGFGGHEIAVDEPFSEWRFIRDDDEDAV